VDQIWNDSSSTTDYAMKEIGIISSPYPQRAGYPIHGLLAMSSRSILTLHDDIAKECLDGLAILIQEENVYHHGETKLPTE
jgi:tRNA (Thr-GGU) A37 N-methylase